MTRHTQAARLTPSMRSWPRALGLVDPTETDAIKQLIAGLGDAGLGERVQRRVGRSHRR
jgi:hypothetical protein